MTKVQSWEVEVRVNGDSVLTIGGEGAAHVAGIENIHDYAGTVETCAHHLLAFIGRPLGLGEPQTPIDVVQHVAWLNQYIIGMDENNWQDMRLRAERQLEGLSAALSISRPLRGGQ